MAGSLWKKEVVIRPTSSISVQEAQDWTKNWLATFQDDADNKDGNGDYIDYFFGDLFDARTGNLYRIFSEAAGAHYNMTEIVFDILITSKFVPWENVSDDTDLEVNSNFLITRGGVKDVLEDTIKNSKIINDAGVLQGDTMQLGHIPEGGIIGAKATIKINNNVYDEVDCTVDDNTLTVLPNIENEYDGKICMVSYLIKT